MRERSTVDINSGLCSSYATLGKHDATNAITFPHHRKDPQADNPLIPLRLVARILHATTATGSTVHLAHFNERGR